MAEPFLVCLVKVIIRNTQYDLIISKPCIKKLFFFLVEQKEITTDQINVYFISKKIISRMHQIYFQDPTPTDCISFPLDDPSSYQKGHILGEIFICPAIAKEYAKEHGEDPFKELSLYLIHGFLHLIGFDDLNPQDRRIMLREQNRLLKAFYKLG